MTDDIRPMLSKDGVPNCTTDECPQYDGKRCRLLGFRPDSICEPAVVRLTSRITEPENMLSDLLAVIHRDGGQVTVAHGHETSCAMARGVIYAHRSHIEELEAFERKVRELIEVMRRSEEPRTLYVAAKLRAILPPHGKPPA